MVKQTDKITRITYSVRLNPDLFKLLKHIAVDENRSIGELLEEGISTILKKRKVAVGHTLDHKRMKSGNDSLDLDDDKYDIPGFLRKQSDQ
jgi:hypothetical protein